MRGRWPTSGPRRLWRCQVAKGYGGLAVRDARVYTLGWEKDGDVLYCIDGDLGNVIWTSRYVCKAGPTLGSRCTPSLDRRWVFVLSRTGELLGIDGDTGRIKWKKDLLAGESDPAKLPRKGLASSPLVMGELVIADVGAVVAVNKQSGDVVWRSEGFAAGYASPVPLLCQGQDMVAVMNSDGPAVLRPDGLTLCKRSAANAADGNGCDPLVVGQRVFCIFSGAGCGLLEPEFPNFNVIWQGKQLTSLSASPVYLNGLIFGLEGLSGQVAITCIQADSGKIKWTGPAMDNATMILADGKLILLTESGELLLVSTDGQGYKELARAKVMSGPCAAPPALAGGRLYCRNVAGDVICVNFK